MFKLPKYGPNYLGPALNFDNCGCPTKLGPDAQNTGYENKFAGTVGAFIFAAAGGIVYFVLNKIGFMASFSGLVGIVCALKGYEIFGKKLSKYGVIISLVAAIIMIIAGWYAGLTQDVYDAYRSWNAEGYVNYMPSFGECMTFAYVFLFEEGVGTSYLINLLIGLGLAVLGGWRTAKTAMMKQAPVKTQPSISEIVEDTADADGPVADEVKPVEDAVKPVADEVKPVEETDRTENSGENGSNMV